MVVRVYELGLNVVGLLYDRQKKDLYLIHPVVAVEEHWIDQLVVFVDCFGDSVDVVVALELAILENIRKTTI